MRVFAKIVVVLAVAAIFVSIVELLTTNDMDRWGLLSTIALLGVATGWTMHYLQVRLFTKTGRSPSGKSASASRSDSAQDRAEGTIKRYGMSGQYGFILWEGDSDLYFHKDDLAQPGDEIYLTEGARVSFVPQLTKQGQRAASVRLLGKTRQGTEKSGPRHSGFVREFHSKKNYGFILARDGRDIFFHASEIADSEDLPRLTLGEPVTYAINQSESRTTAVRLRLEKTRDHEKYRKSGRIKFYNESNQFGFIISDADRSDVYFNAMSLPSGVIPGDLMEDQPVTYLIKQDQKGPIATDIRPVSEKQKN